MKEKIYFFAWLLGLVCVQGGLEAAALKEQNELDRQLPELVRLSNRIKDPVLQKQVGQVIAFAKEVSTPEAAKKALAAVTKAQMHLKQSKLEEKAKKSSSSSSSDCSICSELSSFESDIKHCCHSLHRDLQAILQEIVAESACPASIAIASVPYVISQSGKYCVTEDLVYSGTAVAITVTASNVSINFNNHSLSLTNPAAIGIEVQGNEFLLENDIISGPTGSSTSAAIFLNGVNKATISNVYTQNTTFGIEMINANDVLVENSLFQNHTGLVSEDPHTMGAGVWVETSTGVMIDSCTFEGITAAPVDGQMADGLYITGSNNVSVTNSSFSDWLTSIWVDSATAINIENCFAIPSQFSTASLVQIGDVFSGSIVNDLVIRNSTFMQPYTQPGFDGLLFYQGSEALLENVVVATVTENIVAGYSPGAIHIGCQENGDCDPPIGFGNIYGVDCLVTGQNFNGLYVENGSNVSFTRSQFTEATQANVFFDAAAQNCIISNSVMGNAPGTGYGVLINAGAVGNAIIDSEIANNGAGGVVVAAGATDTFIRGNRIFENGIVGIFNSEPTTAFFFNTSCNNPTNCIGVNPLVDTTPTDAIVAGGNVCCSNT